ncbi:MAG: ATP-binding protein [Acidobacteriota bacterium]|jgi:PAS domain S-box-containing protein
MSRKTDLIDGFERARVGEALRQSQERFRLLFHQSAVGIKRLDHEGHLLEVNNKLCDILGYAREELLQLSLADFTYPADMPHERAQLSRLLSREISSYSVEKRCLRKDGSLIWVRVTSSLPSGSDKPAEWWISVVEDITERKQAEEALRLTAMELARSNKDLEQFAYVASHDLQEPLRMVTAFMQLLEQKYQGKLDATGNQYIHYAVDGAKRMQQLINDLLAYARLGTRTAGQAPVDSGRAFRQALSMLQLSIEESKAQVTAGNLPVVRADEPQLARVFQNLIGNAIKFRSAQPLRIHIDARREDDFWLFSVTDNGIGIDPEYHEKVFMIFQQLHTKEKYPGTGIGLAICRKMVDRHGGRIWVESTVGQGSTFYFTFPL